jgi:hypothetical protein
VIDALTAAAMVHSVATSGQTVGYVMAFDA